MYRAILQAICLALTLSAFTLHAQDSAVATQPQITPEQINHHVLSRMTFCPIETDLRSIQEIGHEAWIIKQLNPASIANNEADAYTQKHYPSLYMSISDAMRIYNPPYTKTSSSPSEQKRRNQLRHKVRHELRSFVIYRAVNSNRQFEEVILNFWRNHFAIDQNKNDVAFLAADFENTLRRHAFDRFDKLLIATAQHPAMLLYLDNHVSQKPLSKREQNQVAAADRRRTPKAKSLIALERQRGLNENYARELMELHTLGVDNGYTQKDVTELARLLTGWTATWSQARNNPNAIYQFHFDEKVHDDNPKIILGNRYPGGHGQREGEAAIIKLARHKNTARFISFKLCQYLLSDTPPDSLVQKTANTFYRSKGDLKKTYRTILLSEEFLNPAHFRSKFRTPFEFTIASLRATSATVSRYDSLLYMMNHMGQNLYRCPDPTGYYDFAEAWLDPGVMIYRWQFAQQLANNSIKGVRAQAISPSLLPVLLDTSTLDPKLTDQLKAQSKAEYTTLILGSPDFQMQ